ncbi:MAG: DUF1848 domain-containing protein [Flavobacteriia bacterium]|nr:DUF1848 domain-containing protein [Flavobacteriia bacterium]
MKKDASTFFPSILSVSRATDIPAFYTDWFINSWKQKYCNWKNPFNSKIHIVSFEKVKAIVFWSKNPMPLFKHFSFIEKEVDAFYLQFTLNNYEKENFEIGLPSLNKRIEIFKKISENLGKKRIIWRFDPLFLSSKTSLTELIDKIYHLTEKLHPYTEKLVFSMADIEEYKKVQRRLTNLSIQNSNFSEENLIELEKHFLFISNHYQLKIATCAENIEWKYNFIDKNKCIDDELLRQITSKKSDLYRLLQVNIDNQLIKKDKGQRKYCGCISSKDIGWYSSCQFNCLYCYAK